MTKSVVCVLALAVLLVGVACTSAEDRQRGLHCIGKWDGQHDGFIEQIKSQMHAPDSFKALGKPWIYPASTSNIQAGKVHIIYISFEGENDSGATVLHFAKGWVDHENCKLIGPVLIQQRSQLHNWVGKENSRTR